MKNLVVFLLSILLSSCTKSYNYKHNSVIIGSIEDKYKILEIDPPKHFDVKIQHLRTGFVYYEIGNRKHCNSWRTGPKVGEIITITTTIYKDTVSGLIWHEPLDDDIINLYCR